MYIYLGFVLDINNRIIMCFGQSSGKANTQLPISYTNTYRVVACGTHSIYNYSVNGCDIKNLSSFFGITRANNGTTVASDTFYYITVGF